MSQWTHRVNGYSIVNLKGTVQEKRTNLVSNKDCASPLGACTQARSRAGLNSNITNIF
jgi:hypothetical protein